MRNPGQSGSSTTRSATQAVHNVHTPSSYPFERRYGQDDCRRGSLQVFRRAIWIRPPPSSTSKRSRRPCASTYFRKVAAWARLKSLCLLRDTLFWLKSKRRPGSTSVSSEALHGSFVGLEFHDAVAGYRH